MKLSDVGSGAQLPAEPSPGGAARKNTRRRDIAAVSVGVVVVIAAAAGVAAARDSGAVHASQASDQPLQAAVVAPTTTEGKIASAMLAAPAAVAEDATILDFPGKD